MRQVGPLLAVRLPKDGPTNPWAGIWNRKPAATAAGGPAYRLRLDRHFQITSKDESNDGLVPWTADPQPWTDVAYHRGEAVH